MKDIKAYIEVPDNKSNKVLITLFEDGWIKEQKEGKEISLTDYMIGFANWCVMNYFECKSGWVDINIVGSDFPLIQTTSELLDIYLKEKGIITE